MTDLNNVISVSCKDVQQFFSCWLIFLKPFHNLTDTEIKVASTILYNRFTLGKEIMNEAILDSVLLNETSRKQIMEQCDISASHLQVILYKLRKSNMIIDNKINPKLIPNYKGEKGLKLLLKFEINDTKGGSKQGDTEVISGVE